MVADGKDLKRGEIPSRANEVRRIDLIREKRRKKVCVYLLFFMLFNTRVFHHWSPQQNSKRKSTVLYNVFTDLYCLSHRKPLHHAHSNLSAAVAKQILFRELCFESFQSEATPSPLQPRQTYT